MTPSVAAALTPTVLAGSAVAALLLVVVAYKAIGALVTIAHEAGHVVFGTLTGHKVDHFKVDFGGQGGTLRSDHGWGPGRILTVFAGYVTPPLLGLGGAALLDAGRAWPLLWTVVVLLVLVLVKAEPEWTTFVVLLFAVAVGYVALNGTPLQQAALAAGLVWLLLFGGAVAAAWSGTDRKSDAGKLARDTLIPAIVWKGVFITVAVVCLWNGVLLLAP